MAFCSFNSFNRMQFYKLITTTTTTTTTDYTSGLQFKIYTNYFNESMTFTSTATLLNGLQGDCSGYSSDMTDISAGTNKNVLVNGALGSFSIEWTGYFYTGANATGTWTFYTNSDDGSYLWIGSNATSGYTTANATVNNGGAHAMQEHSGTITLTTGTYYPIRMLFGNSGGGYNMITSFTPPSGTKTTNGSGYYYSTNVNLPDLLWYKFETGDISSNNLNLKNYSTGDYLATCSTTGMLSTTTSAVGSGSLFMSGSSWVSLLSTNTLLNTFSSTQSGSYTIWFNCTTANPNSSTIMIPFLLAYTDQYNEIGFAIKNSSANKIYIERINIGAQYYNVTASNTIVSINTWNHFAITVSNTSSNNWTYKSYLNGSLISSSTSTTMLETTTGTSFIGSGNKNPVIGYSGDSNFIGYVDDFRVYNRTITSTEIVALYNRTITTPPNDYIVFITMNVSSWTSAVTTDFTGSYTLSSGTTTNTSDATRGYVIPTANDGNHGIVLESPIQSSFCVGNYSYCVWVKITTALSTSQLSGIVGDLNGISSQFHLYFDGAGHINATHGTQANYAVDVLTYTGVTYTTSGWTHIGVTYNNISLLMTLYVNGVSVGSMTKASSWAGITGGKTCFGFDRLESNAQHGYVGLIDNIRIYGREITGNEMSNIYTYENTYPTLPVAITIVNANFIIPAVNSTSISYLGSITGWTITGTYANVSVANGITTYTDTTPPVPQYVTFQTSGTVVTMSQTITISSGTYTVSFYARGRPSSGTELITLSLNGSSVTNTGETSTSGWVYYSFTTTISSTGSYPLTFTSGTVGAFISITGITIA